MKSFFLSIKKLSPEANLSLLIFRLMIGFGMLTHGIPKLMAFTEKMHTFRDPLGIGSPLSLSGTILGEVIAPIFIIAGLFTRIAAIPFTFTMFVASFIVHAPDAFEKKELSYLYVAAGFLIFMMGPGAYSADQKLLKNRE